MIWLLLIVFQVKHFICDYPLQGRYMLGKFKGGNEWILPLAAHAGVHAVWTFLIAGMIRFDLAIGLALFDFVVHFTMDRIKASPNLLGRFVALSKAEMISLLSTDSENKESRIKSNTYFWWSLGIDQSVHHLTHYVIIYMLVS